MMPEGAYRLFDATQVAQAYDSMAERLNAELPDREILLLPVMTGGMFPACELARRIQRPLRIDYVHATRYRGGTSGSDLEWRHWPDLRPGAHSVLLIDDIFDEGHTLAAVRDRLPADYQVTTAALALKRHERGLDRAWLEHCGLVVPDLYVFGCGMDYRENFRELRDIWALPSAG